VKVLKGNCWIKDSGYGVCIGRMGRFKLINTLQKKKRTKILKLILILNLE
jgi:hypothetical protein